MSLDIRTMVFKNTQSSNIEPRVKKHLSILLLASFLSVQLFSLWHLGEHAFESHEHNGQICSVYLHSKAADDLSVPTLHITPLPLRYADAPAHRTPSFHPSATPNYHHARAPPNTLA